VEHRRDGGPTEKKRGGKKENWLEGSGVQTVSNRTGDWVERKGTWNGKRVEGEEIDWRPGRTGSRLMTQKGVLFRCEPRESLGGEREVEGD
jgi:hypothetical protein